MPCEGKETIAIALVINGQEIWIGNDEYETDPNARYEGTLKNLSQAIDRLQLGGAGPPGSKAIVVSYSTGAEIKLPMGDLKAVTGAALGTQRDYRGKIGTDTFAIHFVSPTRFVCTKNGALFRFGKKL